MSAERHDEIVALIACAVTNLDRASNVAKGSGFKELHERIESVWCEADDLLTAEKQDRKAKAGK